VASIGATAGGITGERGTTPTLDDRGHGYPVPVPTTAIQTAAGSEWDAMRERLARSFPDLPEGEVLAELVHAHDAVDYVGTPEAERSELVEFIARYGLMVRTGQVSPSDRLDPERHASPRRN
jgi:hypothetical protein